MTCPLESLFSIFVESPPSKTDVVGYPYPHYVGCVGQTKGGPFNDAIHPLYLHSYFPAALLRVISVIVTDGVIPCYQPARILGRCEGAPPQKPILVVGATSEI
ncbi:hypothetical protein CDAR_165921 [Caerostris darwini]|uniref:Uncharacterized protein n=1 Tax=Caerostris darwini TaxID=1538125 RepID=A0AAV4RX22_9ARAC|nr:hypothetical protein CDAR_165921 [Caerostris darwini]